MNPRLLTTTSVLAGQVMERSSSCRRRRNSGPMTLRDRSKRISSESVKLSDLVGAQLCFANRHRILPQRSRSTERRCDPGQYTNGLLSAFTSSTK